MVLVQTYGISRSQLNHRRQLLRWLHSRDRCGNKIYQTFSCSPSWPYLESDCDDLSSVLWYLQITLEPPTSITETTAYTRWMWKHNIKIFSFFPSSMFEESECDGLSSDLRYLQITFGPPINVNVTRHRSCSKSQEFLDQAWRETVSAKWCCRYLGLHNKSRWFVLQNNPAFFSGISIAIIWKFDGSADAVFL